MDEQLARVAGKLRMAGPSGAAAPFGRVGRKNDAYVLNPPLPEERVAAFERAHGVRLPEEYRRFVLEVGNGDTGHGLFSLDEAYRELGAAWGDEPGEDPGFLALPSPYRKGETYTCEWWDARYGPDDRMDQLHGTLPVQQGGCSDFCFLVVTGPDEGAVYSANWDGNAPPARVGDDFLGWLERNLDSRVLGYGERWSEPGLRGRERKLLDVLSGDPHEYRRMAAAFALRRRRKLSEAAKAALADAMRDRHYVVRTAAVSVVRDHGLRELSDDVRRAADDEVAAVRQCALHALAAVGHDDLTAVARALLSDPAPWTREHAIRILHEHGALTAADVERLLDDPVWTVRREAVCHLPELDAGTRPLSKALADTEPYVRSLAVDQVAERTATDRHDLLTRALAAEQDRTIRSKLEYHLRQAESSGGSS